MAEAPPWTGEPGPKAAFATFGCCATVHGPATREACDPGTWTRVPSASASPPTDSGSLGRRRGNRLPHPRTFAAAHSAGGMTPRTKPTPAPSLSGIRRIHPSRHARGSTLRVSIPAIALRQGRSLIPVQVETRVWRLCGPACTSGRWTAGSGARSPRRRHGTREH